MGFKRTTEGRVFFQGTGDSANDEESAAEQGRASQRPSLPSQGSQQTQLQILTLLKSLNDKLKITQAERNRMRTELETYREVIEDLENKAARSEIALSEMEQKISRKGTEGRALEAEKLARDTLKELEETRRLLLAIESKADRADKNVATLASVQKAQSEKIAARLKESEEKQQELGGKLEETITGQARLGRKVDKAIEDRARFMRKIERIEETVIQTRDALNARAMVLLTDQNPAAQTSNEIPAAETFTSANAATTPVPFWRRRLDVAPAGIIPVIAVVLLAGWLFSTAQKASLPDLSGFNAKIFNNEDVAAPEATAAIEQPEQPYEVPFEKRAPAPEWNVQEDTTAFSAADDAAAFAAPSEPEVIDDIGTVPLNDDAAMLALLENNPDALAEQLNAIEPGEATADEALPVDVPAQEERVAMADARATRPPTPPITAPTRAAPALTSMKPDSGLPPTVKPIEDQAFEGIPEAQHDLAAVYTAGHAGVKQNYERAAFWFSQAADQGVANARYNLGVLYHQGLGVKKDVEEALRWYKSAADLGHPEAQYNLGIAYIEGIGVPYDPVQAGINFERAADSGVMEAAYNLGLIYENGLLGQPKPDAALMWYKTAADRGSPEAKAALEQLAKTLGIGLDEVNRVVENLRKSKAPPAAENKASAPAPGKTSSVTTPLAAPPVETASAPAAEQPAVQTAAHGQEQVMVSRVQAYLMRIGLYPGPADGVIGPLTEDAIRSYQAANDLYVNGQPTQDLLAHMMAMDEPAPASRVNN